MAEQEVQGAAGDETPVAKDGGNAETKPEAVDVAKLQSDLAAERSARTAAEDHLRKLGDTHKGTVKELEKYAAIIPAKTYDRLIKDAKQDPDKLRQAIEAEAERLASEASQAVEAEQDKPLTRRDMDRYQATKDRDAETSAINSVLAKLPEGKRARAFGAVQAELGAIVPNGRYADPDTAKRVAEEVLSDFLPKADPEADAKRKAAEDERARASSGPRDTSARGGGPGNGSGEAPEVKELRDAAMSGDSDRIREASAAFTAYRAKLRNAAG